MVNEGGVVVGRRALRVKVDCTPSKSRGASASRSKSRLDKTEGFDLKNTRVRWIILDTKRCTPPPFCVFWANRCNPGKRSDSPIPDYVLFAEMNRFPLIKQRASACPGRVQVRTAM